MSAPAKPAGEVVTFYSYKGGTGRTMSLVNLACLLADKLPFGEKILLVDWDLEAPGLHRYFHETLRPLKSSAGSARLADNLPGVIDLFTTLLEYSREATIRRKRNQEIKARALLDRIDLADYIAATVVPNLHVIKAGRFDADYADRINDFDWAAFYDAQPLVFRELAERLKRNYRYVFVDSRTGQTDTAGICTGLLPEKLVAVFTPNRQSLLGLETVLQQAIAYRKAADDTRPLVVYPLPSRVEIDQDALRRTWRFGDAGRRIEGYEPFFSRLFGADYGLKYCHLKKYFDEVQIKQSSIYAFGEEIAVREERSHKVEDTYSLTQAYQNLLNWMQAGYLPWEHPEAIRLLKALEARTSASTVDLEALAELVGEANQLSALLYAEANYGNAYILAKHTLRQARKALGDRHPATLNSMNNLASTLQAQGDLAAARTLQDQVLTVSRRVLGDEHPDTLNAMNNLAGTLRAQGDRAAARALQDQALAVRRRVLGDEHPDTLSSMNNLAGTLRAQGDLGAARALHEQALAVRRRVLGDEHPDTLNSMNNLAAALYAQGDLVGALALQEQALAACRRILGDEHPDTLTSMNNLAAALCAQGDLGAARALEEQALAVSRRVLGEEHPATLISMSNLAGTLRAQGDLPGALELQGQALVARRHVLGEEHPDTLNSMNNLAVTLSAQGDLAAARAFQEQALAGRRRVLGDEHPDTLSSMNNLAATLREQGEFASARRLLEELLASQHRKLGAEHPAVLDVLFQLLRLAEAEGNWEEASRIRGAIEKGVGSAARTSLSTSAVSNAAFISDKR